MRTYKYPQYREHKKLHEELIKHIENEISALRNQLQNHVLYKNLKTIYLKILDQALLSPLPLLDRERLRSAQLLESILAIHFSGLFYCPLWPPSFYKKWPLE